MIKTKYISFLIFTLLFNVKNYSQSSFFNLGKNSSESVLGIHSNLVLSSSTNFSNDGLVYVFKDLHNEGIVNFENKETSKLFLTGENTQKITGFGDFIINDIIIDNKSQEEPIVLSSVINISGNCSFLNGVIITDNPESKLIFEDDATYSNLSDKSFFSGKVTKVGNDSFTFPIGKRYKGELFYRGIKIEKPNNISDVFSAEYFAEGIDIDYPRSEKEKTIDHISTEEYWILNRDLGISNPKITISLSDFTTDTELLINISNLTIVRWNGTKWVSEGAEVDLINQTISTKPSSYGVFTIATLDLDIDNDSVLNIDEDLNSDGNLDNDDTDKDGIPNYLDNDDDGDGILSIDEDGNQNGILTDDDCDNDTIADYLDPTKCDLPFPTSFSPNGDGLNDVFVIPNLAQDYPDFIIQIYNRYGNIVYNYSNNGSKKPKWWNGKSTGRLNIQNNEVVPSGTYWYVIDYNNGSKKPEQAWLYLNK
jgi:gliding motility-associated-like protein